MTGAQHAFENRLSKPIIDLTVKRRLRIAGDRQVGENVRTRGSLQGCNWLWWHCPKW